jgi:hypothetical protein
MILEGLKKELEIIRDRIETYPFNRADLRYKSGWIDAMTQALMAIEMKQEENSIAAGKNKEKEELELAITHATEVAKNCMTETCKTEHLQLAGWLIELRDRRIEDVPK